MKEPTVPSKPPYLEQLAALWPRRLQNLVYSNVFVTSLQSGFENALQGVSNV